MSPLKEAREPVNENIGRGTGIGTLMPICSKRNGHHPHMKYEIINFKILQIYCTSNNTLKSLIVRSPLF